MKKMNDKNKDEMIRPRELDHRIFFYKMMSNIIFSLN
jgi:hypothetical protein